MQRRRFLAGLGALSAAHALELAYGGRHVFAQAEPALRGPDVVFVPTPEAVVDRMLEMAQVTSKDVVYDLGSGDGRIVIAAARKYGARGVGVEIDAERIAEARANAKKAGVTDRVTFIHGDLFEANISAATVVTLYLLTDLNIKLKPKLMKELRPGTRVVSHAFGMGTWEPEKSASVGGAQVYLWRIPPLKR